MYINIATGLTNIMLFYPVGMIADKISAKILMPLSGLAVALVACSFIFIKDPMSPISFVIWCLLSISI